MESHDLPPKNLWLPDVVEDFEKKAARICRREESVLFWEGDPSNRVFFVEKGLVQMYHYTREGVTVPLLFHQRGELVGLGGILCDTIRKVNAKTSRPSVLWEISRANFLQILRDYPDVAIWVAISLSERLRITDQEVLRAVVMEADCRLAIVLLDLAQGAEAQPFDGGVRIFTTHQELAQMVGACRQTVTTTLGKFRRQGLLRTGKGSLELLDLKTLAVIAGRSR